MNVKRSFRCHSGKIDFKQLIKHQICSQRIDNIGLRVFQFGCRLHFHPAHAVISLCTN